MSVELYAFEGLAIPRHDNGWDSLNERILVDGVVLEPFNQNPVVIKDFHYDKAPIAKAKVWIDNEGLHVAMGLTKELAREVITSKLIPSVGFTPILWDEVEGDHYIYIKLELLCISLISEDKDCYKKFRVAGVPVIHPCGPPEIFDKEHELWEEILKSGTG